MRKKEWFWVAVFIGGFTMLMHGQEAAPRDAIRATGTALPLSPAQAAEIMRGPAMQSNMANRTVPPPAAPSIVVQSTPGASTWLQFPAPAEPRRLDGTPLSLPPVNYGGRTSTVIVVGSK